MVSAMCSTACVTVYHLFLQPMLKVVIAVLLCAAASTSFTLPVAVTTVRPSAIVLFALVPL
jgi:hypothetical protein